MSINIRKCNRCDHQYFREELEPLWDKDGRLIGYFCIDWCYPLAFNEAVENKRIIMKGGDDV